MATKKKENLISQKKKECKKQHNIKIENGQAKGYLVSNYGTKFGLNTHSQTQIFKSTSRKTQCEIDQ